MGPQRTTPALHKLTLGVNLQILGAGKSTECTPQNFQIAASNNLISPYLYLTLVLS